VFLSELRGGAGARAYDPVRAGAPRRRRAATRRDPPRTAAAVPRRPRGSVERAGGGARPLLAAGATGGACSTAAARWPTSWSRADEGSLGLGVRSTERARRGSPV